MTKRIFMFLALLVLSFTQLNIVDATPTETHTVTYYDEYVDGINERILFEEEVLHGFDAYFHKHKKVGYDFVGWDPSITNITEDRKVYAVFTPVIYPVEFLSLDGSVIVTSNLPRDYVFGVLNEQTRLMYNIGFTENDVEFTEYVPEVTEEEQILLADNIIWHIEITNKGTHVTEYVIEVDGYELASWDDLSPVAGARQIAGVFTEIEDDIVVVDPEEPEIAEINFTESDFTMSTLTDSSTDPESTLLNAAVGGTFLMSAIDSLLEYTNSDVLAFPEINPDDENGVSYTIPKDALIYAEDYDVDLQFSSQGYTIVIPHEGLTNILDSIVTDLTIEIRQPSRSFLISFDLEEYTGQAFEAVEINILGSASNIRDFNIEVSIDTDHELVLAIDDTYTLLTTETTTGGRTGTIQNNGILIKTTLEEKEEPTPTPPPVEPEERFDVIEWVQDLDTTVIILGSVGSFLAIYLIVYVVDIIIRRD